MAFGFLKKAINGVGKAAGFVGRKVVPIVNVAAPILELVVPAPIIRVAKKAGKVLKIVNRTQAIVPGMKLFIERDHNMNPMESAVRGVVSIALTLQKKSGMEIALSLVPMLLEIQKISELIKDIPRAQFILEVKTALDNMIGTEPNALIGPGENALIHIDVPFVGIEQLTDLILDGAVKALAQAPDPTPFNPPPATP